MRIDFRMTALVTAVTVVLTQIYGIYITLTSNPTFPWTLVVQFVIGLLLFVPFPVLLFLLYKTGTIPEVAGKLRNLAIVIALVYGAHLVVNNFYIIYMFHHREFLLYALNLISGIVYLVFLVALSKQDQGRPAANKRQARLVWDAARVTLLAAWGSVAMRVVGIGVSTVRYERMLAAYHWELRT